MERPTPLSESEFARVDAAENKFRIALMAAVLSSAAAMGAWFLFGPQLPRFAPLAIIVIGWAPFYYVIYLVRRCPRCEKSIGNRPAVAHCPKCGVELKRR